MAHRRAPVAELTPDLIVRMLDLKDRESKMAPGHHPPTEDREKGCPNLPSLQKIRRYLRALSVYDEPSCAIASSGYIEIMRNARHYLDQEEYMKLLRYMKDHGCNKYVSSL